MEFDPKMARFSIKTALFSPALAASRRPASFGWKPLAEICTANTAAGQEQNSVWSPLTVLTSTYAALLRGHGLMQTTTSLPLVTCKAKCYWGQQWGYLEYHPHLQMPTSVSIHRWLR